ncbi:MAG: pantetheine-phosphate adenylyltransferase [Clostridia bacterium]|nr:pantetheine-phosphate adenylyltransferase [Clostridia bacterium]
MTTKALFTGSFDPITNGHLELIRRASKMFDSVTVAVIINYSKVPMFSVEERKQLIREVTADLPNVEADSFEGLLADYVNEKGFNIVIRGLRNTTDFNYELQMEQVNARLFKNGTQTVYLMADPQYSFVSSSIMKEVHSLSGDISGLVPDTVLERMNEKKKEL